VQGLGIVGIFLKDLAAAELSLEISPCAQVVENGLMKRNARGGAPRGGDCFGGGLLLATIHDFKRFKRPDRTAST
jgi:hypothetical protein